MSIRNEFKKLWSEDPTKFFNELGELLDDVKPINLTTLIIELFEAPSFKKGVSVMVRILELYSSYWSVSSELLTQAAYHILRGVSYLIQKCKDLWSWLKNLIKRDPITTPVVSEMHNEANITIFGYEIDETWGKFAVSILSIIIPIGAILTGGLLTATTSMGTTIAKTLNQTGGALRGVDSAVSSFKSLSTVLTGTFNSLFGIKEEESHKEKLIKRIDEVAIVLDNAMKALRSDPGAALNDANFLPDLEKGIKDTEELYRIIAVDKDNLVNARLLIETLRYNYIEIKKLYTHLINTVVGKQIPVVIWLYGPSGIGKSEFAKKLVSMLSFRLDRELLTYSRNSSSPHWDGYQGQDVVLYDDFGANAENLDHDELQKIYTNAAYMPRMAAIADKATRFTSRFVIVCSNFPFIDKSKVLTNAHILQRRRDIVVEVSDPVATAQFQNGNLTMDKSHYKEDMSHLILTHKKIGVRQGATDLENMPTPIVRPTALVNMAVNLFEERKVEYDDMVSQKLQAFKNGYAIMNSDVWEDAVTVDNALAARLSRETRERATNIGRAHGVQSVQAVDLQPESQYIPQEEINRRNGAIAEMRQIMPRILHGERRILNVDQRIINLRMQLNAARRPEDAQRIQAMIDEIEMEDAIDQMQGSEEERNLLRDELRPLTNHVKKLVKRPPIILLIGEPGCGKTQASSFCGLPHYDEIAFDEESFLQALHVAWKYDDPDFEGAIMTCNSTSLDFMFEKMYPNDVEKQAAFFRRMQIFRFDFRKKGLLWRTKYTVEDLQNEVPYDNCVRITHKDKQWSYDQLVAYLRKPEVREDVIELPTDDMYDTMHFCDAEVNVNISFNEMLDPNWNPTFRDIMGLLQVAKGSTAELLQLAQTFKCLFGYQGLTVETAIQTFNRQKFPHKGCSIAGNFTCGGRIQITSEEGVMVARLVSDMDKLEFLGMQNVDTSFLKFEVKETTEYKIRPYFEAFGFLMKMGGAFLALYKGKHEESMQNEGTWAEEMDVIDPDGTICATHQSSFEKKLPKSAMDRRSNNLEYCVVHHKMDRCFVNEAHRRFLDVYNEQKQKADNGQHFNTESTKADVSYVGQMVKQREKHPLMQETTKSDVSYVGQMVKQKVKHPLVSESMNDPNALTYLEKVAGNTVMIMAAPDKTKILCRGVMLKERLGVTTNHGMHDEHLFVNVVGRVLRADIIHRNELRDLAFFQLPRDARQYSDITHLFRRKTDPCDMSSAQAILQIATPKENGVNVVQRIVYPQTLTTRRIDDVKRYGMTYVGHCEGHTYDPICTTYGDCGSMVCLLNPSQQRKLLGIHSAGSSTTGFVNIIYQEDIDGLDLKSESALEFKVLQHQAVQLEPEIKDYKLFKIVGRTVENDGTEYKQFHPPQTKYWKSPLHWEHGKCTKEMEVEYEPAILSPCDSRCPPGVDPYVNAMDKWSKEQPEFDMDLLNRCVDSIGEYYADEIAASNYKLKVLTKTEAINGISSIPGSNPIYRHSSAGYPMKHWKGVSSKTVFFEQKNGLQVLANNEQGRKLTHAVDALIEAAKKGQRTAVVFASALKDEPLKMNKIREGKTRSFAGSPIDYTLAHRTYFHAAGAAITSLHRECPIKVGINPLSTDWDLLYHSLSKVSDQGFDCDFQAWDATVPRVMMEMLPKIYNKIYQRCDPNWKEEDDIARTALHSCMHGPLMTYYDRIVQAPGGQITGQPATALDNSLINFIYTFYVYMKLARVADVKKANFHTFREVVACAFFGDDNMITMAAEISHWFNFVSYRNMCATIGLTVTNANKDGKEEKMKPLKDLEFLKRTFVRVDGKYYGCLLPASLTKMLSWCTTHKNHKIDQEPNRVKFDRNSIYGTIDSALRESALHGHDFFYKIRDHLSRMKREWRIPGPNHLMQYRDAIDLIQSGKILGQSEDPESWYESEN